MATSYDVNLKIGSAIGYNAVGRGLIFGLAPIQTTTLTLDGDAFAPSGYNTGTRTLSVQPLVDFISSPGTTSTRQLVQLTNNGTAILTITNILYSLNENINPRVYFPDDFWLSGDTTKTLLPNDIATFQLAYIATEAGEYNNYLIFVSNDDSGYYKLPTRQLVVDTTDFYISPTGVSTATDIVGYNNVFTYNIVPVFNSVERPDLVIPIINPTITGSPAWSILNTGTNSISVLFNANHVNNVNGTYVSTLTVVSNSLSRQVTNTATITVDYNKNKHLCVWLSPASHDNSIIGASYDLIDNARYLTIGVGMGGEDSPVYSQGGNANLSMDNIGPGANADNYPYWSKVYRIPFSGTATTYYSNDYVDKTTTATDYSSYFGEFDSAGSMFVVEDDGYGSIKVELNNLIEFTTSTVTTSTWTTLNNLTRAFHYYSNVDIDGRISTAPEYSSPLVFDTNTTQLFTGFDYNTRDRIATTATSIVAVP